MPVKPLKREACKHWPPKHRFCPQEGSAEHQGVPHHCHLRGEGEGARVLCRQGWRHPCGPWACPNFLRQCQVSLLLPARCGPSISVRSTVFRLSQPPHHLLARSWQPPPHSQDAGARCAARSSGHGQGQEGVVLCSCSLLEPKQNLQAARVERGVRQDVLLFALATDRDLNHDVLFDVAVQRTVPHPFWI